MQDNIEKLFKIKDKDPSRTTGNHAEIGQGFEQFSRFKDF
jgi:hypothetical protein